jgi:hypothetical protein
MEDSVDSPSVRVDRRVVRVILTVAAPASRAVDGRAVSHEQVEPFLPTRVFTQSLVPSRVGARVPHVN